MKTAALLVASACACLAAIGNFRVLGTTATQALIAYTAPDGNACTIQLSQSAGFTPLALDLDPATFANSNSDLSRSSTVTAGLSRTVVLGQRTAQLATAGTYSGVRHFSRSLEAYTPYFGQITCPSTGDNATFNFTTANIPLGQTYGDPWLSDPSHPGDQPWPESVGGLTPEFFIDPLTGTLQYRIGLRGNNPLIWNLAFGSAFNQGQTTPCDSAGPWTSPCNVTAGSGNTTVGNSTAPLVLRPSMSANNPPWNTSYGQFFSLDQIGLGLTGFVNSTTAAFRNLDVCLSLNGGVSCAGSMQQMTMGQTSGLVTLGDAPVNYYVASNFGVDEWVLDTNPRLNSQESSAHSGTATVTNNSGTYTVTNNNTGDTFSLYWITGGNGTIRLSSNNDACITPPASTTSAEYRIGSFADGNNIVLASGTPPTGSSIYWCEDNFTLMVWRDQAPTDGSTVTLTGAVLNALGSEAPQYPDNGAGTACFSKLVYGGYFCLYGNFYWINPTGPVVAYYGQPEGSGNSIANSWSLATAPTSESASIDQTQSNLTNYMVSFDPARTSPLVIQSVFIPGSTPSQPTVPQVATGTPQIQNATVASTTAYSVTWSNGLTWTNLTPQSTVSESVFDQMAAFDPTFTASYYSTLDCGTNSAATQGVFFFICNSAGQNSPAWIFALSPGTGSGYGNGACAGPTACGGTGPRIIGAMTTFNTPNGPVASGQGALTGRGLHGIAETGETGWIGVSANEYLPITTSANSVPSSSSACSTFSGLSSLSGQCIALAMNSYTAHSVTGYEPYFASPTSPFLGTPGELRTTQIGDTACVTTTSAASCTYANPETNELMTLVQKNSGGNWVFQRATYNAEVAVSGPLALWWESWQSSTPPGSTGSQQANVQVFWNPTAGCPPTVQFPNGSPDPHGNCLIEDVNEEHSHVEYRNGGESQQTNVPEWGQPIWGWPFDYQAILGPVPCILGLGFANVTPYQVTTDGCVNPPSTGVNFVAAEPPFAGVYGHPWGFDAGSHPNAAGVNAPPNESIRAFDNLPVEGGQNEPAFTAVTGQPQLYFATPSLVTDPDDPFGSGTIVAINRKLMATGASCGSHPLIDVSGPSSSIVAGTAGSYTYCFARTAGECYAGSTVGQVYANCPGVVWTYCTGTSIHGGTPLGVGNDICVGNIGNGADAIIQYSLDRTDYNGATRRALVSATSRLRMVFGFENNQLLPDNSWILYRQELLNYQRVEMWMAKNLPYPPADSVARWTFVPWPVSVSPPAGLDVNNAIVEFGYQEYGAPQLINCTTRNDACIATAGTPIAENQPFYFASENPAGASCASGCTITIPAISQRILYYQVKYRAANNTVLAADPPNAIVVP